MWCGPLDLASRRPEPPTVSCGPGPWRSVALCLRLVRGGNGGAVSALHVCGCCGCCVAKAVAGAGGTAARPFGAVVLVPPAAVVGSRRPRQPRCGV